MEYLIVALCYKFGYSLEYVLGLTIPQIKILESNLSRILKAEAGEKETENKPNANNQMLAGTVKMLEEKTGRKEFTMIEILNPEETLRKHNG